MLSKVSKLMGYRLRNHDEELGGVRDLYFDDELWTIRYLVADTGNWLTGRQVLISPHAIVDVDSETEQISVNLSKKQIEDCPSSDSDRPISREYEAVYSGYFGYPSYWCGPYMWGTYPYAGGAYALAVRPNAGPKVDEPSEPRKINHLRSTHDVSGHHIMASDGEIGHVKDFFVEDKTWAIRYLLVDTVNWWPGKKVLISPKWITGVSWSESKVFVNLTRDLIQSSPEYTDSFPLDRQYEDAIHQHYGEPGYWVKQSDAKQPVEH
jgi:hypothetical protein